MVRNVCRAAQSRVASRPCGRLYQGPLLDDTQWVHCSYTPYWGIAMRIKLVRIGNSRGIRIPKPLLEQAGLSGEVELSLVDSRIVIEAASQPRAGWAEAASDFHARGEDQLLDEVTRTDFDIDEWDW